MGQHGRSLAHWPRLRFMGTIRSGEDPALVGLCWNCRHARVVRTPRSTFWRCQLSDTDPRFDKYPQLPILECDGYEPKPQRD